MKTYLLQLSVGGIIGALGAACGASSGDSLMGSNGDLTGASGKSSDSNGGGSSRTPSSAGATASSDGGMYNPNQAWYGDAAVSATTDPAAPANTPVELAAGQKHTCARMQDGTVRCWGDDLEGQLGGSSRLLPIAGLSGVVSIGAGLSHSCAVTSDGAAYCWGANALNQLGDGRGGPGGSESTSETPVAVRLTAGKKAIRVFVNANASCVQFDDHTIQCWGAEAYDSDVSGMGGQFNATLSAKSGSAAQIVSIAAVQYNLSTFALLLGDGTVLSAVQAQSTPPSVMSFSQKDPSDPIVSLRGGDAFLAVSASGKLYAVGRDNATLTVKYCKNFGCSVTEVRPARSLCFCTNVPTGCLDGNCTTGPTANDCSVFLNYPDNTANTCERNEAWTPDLWLPLETSSCSRVSSFANATVNLNNDVTESVYDGPPAVPAGYDDSSEDACVNDMRNNVTDPGMCNLPGNGDASQCTFNPIFSGGDDQIAADSSAKFVDLEETMVASSSAGFACGLKSDGHVYCWGHNNVGQLGQGNIYNIQGAQFARPAVNFQPVHGPQGIVELVVGASHSCARSATNQVYCWGENAPAFPSARLGNSAAVDGTVPLEPISFVPEISVVDAGYAGQP